MPRGERIVRGIGDQQLHAAVQPAGARAGDEIFQAGITHQHTGDKPHKQENALPAVFFCAQKNERCQDSDRAAVAKQRDLRHQEVENRTTQRAWHEPIVLHGCSAFFIQEHLGKFA